MFAVKETLDIGSTYNSVIEEIDSMLVATANQKDTLLTSIRKGSAYPEAKLQVLRERYRMQFHKVRAYHEKLDIWRQQANYTTCRTEIIDYLYLLSSLEIQTTENIRLALGLENKKQ